MQRDGAASVSHRLDRYCNSFLRSHRRARASQYRHRSKFTLKQALIRDISITDRAVFGATMAGKHLPHPSLQPNDEISGSFEADLSI
jgi:hypothetical protein